MDSNNVVIDEKLLAENSDFLKTVVEAKTFEEAQKICADYNIELPDDALEAVKSSFNKDAELNEDELCNISGGKVSGENLLKTVGGVVGLGGAVAAGSAAGVLVACAWVGYYAYKTFK